MTGLDCLREEMIKRGGTAVMCQSKTAAMVLDIVAHTPDGIYAKTQEAEEKLVDLRKSIEAAQRDCSIAQLRCKRSEEKLNEVDREISAGLSQLSKAKQKELDDIREYIDKFNESLQECETPEERDRMRTAQLFVDSVDVNTKYDNTAFIIGLASILSRGKVAAIDELKKINNKIAAPSDLPEWLEDMEE